MASVIRAGARQEVKDSIRKVLQDKLKAVPAAPRDATELRPIDNHDEQGRIKPFQQLLFPEGLLRPWEFERTFSTALGRSFEVAARIIGKSRFDDAQNGLNVEGRVSPAARSAIDDILRDIRRDGMKTSYHELVGKVVGSYVGSSGSTEKVKVDLYLRTVSGEEFFLEMKSPKPNKDQCVGTTEKLLLLHAMRGSGPPSVRTYYAMAFNPYGDDVPSYKHSLALKYLDIDEQVLLGRAFWDMVGGPGTYQELLSIYREIGEEVRPEVIRRFGL
jgi:hypothetical protein